jgi:hypothetical protein
VKPEEALVTDLVEIGAFFTVFLVAFFLGAVFLALALLALLALIFLALA